MFKQENPNFIASKHAPNPKEVSYWIDLSSDSTGNVIRSYSPDMKKWIPLNREANVDQWTHIKEIVNALGLKFDRDSDIISLPNLNSNNYFKGNTIVDSIKNGDKAVKQQVDRLDTKIDDVNEDLQSFKSTKGKPNGLASLDGNGKVPSSQLPSYVDDVVDAYATYTVSPTGVLQNIKLYRDAEHNTAIVGEPDKIYVNVTTGEVGYQFRWTGTQWAHIDSNAIIIGNITGTAFDGGKGTALQNKVNNVSDTVDDLGNKWDSLPSSVVSDLSVTNDINTCSIEYTYEYQNSDGQFISASTAGTAAIPVASNTEAGIMTGSDAQLLRDTIPGMITDEQTARTTAVNELKAKDTELKQSIDANNTTLGNRITNLNNDLLKVNDAVGLTDQHNVPDLSNTNYIKNATSVVSAAVLLDDKINDLHDEVNRNADELWYGVKFNLATNSSPDGIRTGNMEMHATLPVQSKMKGCVITNTGNSLRYLKADDWTKFDDGTTVTNDVEGGFEYFVEIPEHYRLMLATPDNNIEIRISEYNLPGYIKVDKKYVSAYEGTFDSASDTMLHSHVSSNSPLTNKTREQFQTLARTNRTNNWNMYTYDIHKDITWLFVVEYATLNSQKEFNATLTAEGYHQGGLGAGVTTGVVQVNGNNVYSFVPTGVTNVLGNNTGIIEYTRESKTVNVPRYRGIENMFGHVWKNVIDVIVTGTDNSVYLTRDYTKFGNDKSQLQLQDFKEALTNGYVSATTNNNDCDLFPVKLGGSSGIYYCDYHYTNLINSDRTLLVGGNSDCGADAGLFYLNSGIGLGHSTASVGSRLTFYAEPLMPVSLSTLELTESDYETFEYPEFSEESLMYQY